MSNIFVVPAADIEQGKDPRLAYKSLASEAFSIVASHDQSNVAYTYDGMTTLKWRPAATSSSIIYTGTFLNTDYLAIAGSNFNTAGAAITIKDTNDNIIGTVSGLEDNQPVFFIFTKQTYTEIKVEFTCANSSLEVGEIYFGESLAFPRNVAVGYSPGRWHSNDEITTSRTEGNQFAASTVRARGTTESFTINYVPTLFMEGSYKAFINDAKGVPVFFLWNKQNINNAVFGYWNARKPQFTSSLFSSISIDIDGVA